MKKIGLVFVLLLAIAGYFMYPKAPEMKGFKLLKLPNWSKSQVLIEGEAKFSNPNYFGLTLKNHDIDVFIAEQKIGNIKQSESRSIPAREEFAIPMKLLFERKKVLGGKGLLKSLFNSFAQNDLTAHFVGKVEVSVLGIGIPVDVDFEEKLIEHNLGTEETEE